MKQKKTRRRRTVLIVLVILLILLAALAVWQRNNIKALISAATQSQEQIEEQIKQNDQALKDAVEALPGVDIRDITEEEREALRDGTLTLDELLDRLLEDSSPTPSETPQVSDPPDVIPEVSPSPTPTPTVTPSPSVTPTPGPTPTSDPTPTPMPTPTPTPTPAPTPASTPTPTPSELPEEQSDYERRLNELIARAFVLREEYLLALDNMQKAALEDYKKIPEEERNAKGMAIMVETYISSATKLEAECDAKMDALVTELKALQREYGQSMDVVDTVKYTYANEKSLKKAWYMEELRKRGLI